MQTTKKIQSLATIGSFTCFIHCLITPILISIAPSIGNLFNNHVIEILLLIISLICGIFIIYTGYNQHKKLHSIYLFSIGGVMWVSHYSLELLFHRHSEITLLILGSIFICISYIVNHQFKKSNNYHNQ